MNMYEARDKILKYEKAVFSINEISRILGINKNVASVYINRMIKKGLLYKIERNKVSSSDDIFVVSSQLIFPAYISLTSALYLNNAFSQIINKIYVFTTKKRKRAKIFDSEIIFVNINPRLLFGYKKVKKGSSFVMLADLEKTIVDCLCFPRYCRLNYLLEALKNADIKKFESYIKIADKEAVLRRAGYLLDVLRIKHSLKRRTKVSYKLNPSVRSKGKFNNRWYLYVNEVIR